MAKRSALAALVVLAGVLLLPACVVPEESCLETEQPLIEPMFRIHFAVTDAGGAPHVGPISVEFSKHYCDGTVKGNFPDSGTTDAAGQWSPTIVPVYKLANDGDFVGLAIAVGGQAIPYEFTYAVVSTYARVDIYTGIYTYEDTVEVTLD